MFKQISVLVLIFIFNLCAFAQTEYYNAPVKWERYVTNDENVSVLFPKLPILLEISNVCNEQKTDRYAAYADGIVYGLNVTSRIKQNSRIPCYQQEKFDESSFYDRLSEIKTQLKTPDEMKFNQNNLEITKIKNVSESSVFWLINDFQNKRWFEFWIVGTNNENANIKNFVESLQTGKKLQGVKVGSGSNRTLGDEGVADKMLVITKPEKKEKEIESEKTQNIKIILKPYPKYTDAARQNNVRGTVRLQVTFLASGGIGSISQLNALPYGLTEQAIAVARKIVFLPVKIDGTPYSVTKIVEYSFSIY